MMINDEIRIGGLNEWEFVFENIGFGLGIDVVDCGIVGCWYFVVIWLVGCV